MVWYVTRSASTPGVGENVDQVFGSSAGSLSGTYRIFRICSRHAASRASFCFAEKSTVAGTFDGLGLRGNASSPMTAEGLRVPRSAMIGADGAGLDLALAAVLPVFLICNASMSAGLMRRLPAEAP